MSADLELSIERTLDAPIAAVWRAWTEHLEEWWAPKPWTAKIVEQDLRAGGKSVIDMRGPDGEGGPMDGIFLEVTPERRIAFTNALDGDWNPKTPYPGRDRRLFRTDRSRRQDRLSRRRPPLDQRGDGAASQNGLRGRLGHLRRPARAGRAAAGYGDA
jgi:uncharacterized protein YndB with AHSA1/START domain